MKRFIKIINRKYFFMIIAAGLLALNIFAQRGDNQLRNNNRPPRRENGQEYRNNEGQGIEKPRDKKDNKQTYSLEQAMSKEAQLHTISFNGLAFITGDFGAATFMPPGKVCDFFGFQYMRDIDAAEKGHNPIFLNRVAGNVFKNLNDAQKKIFWDLASEQSDKLEDLAKMRIPVIKAFYRELKGEIPQGSAGLNKEAIIKAVGDIFALDGDLSFRRAEVMGSVAQSLYPDQKAYFVQMKFGDFNTWPDVDEKEGIRAAGKGQSKMFNVAYMTYASEFFSWYAGSIVADTYFCPERHGTYFGGFYMKDMPAMGKRDFDISTRTTGDKGQQFLEILNDEQRKNVTELPALQSKALSEAAQVRREISTELRKMLKGGKADKDKVIKLCRRYGELDGEMSWLYTEAFTKVNKTLTDEQKKSLLNLRGLQSYTAAPYYIYSQPMDDAATIPNTDLFFSPPQK